MLANVLSAGNARFIRSSITVTNADNCTSVCWAYANSPRTETEKFTVVALNLLFDMAFYGTFYSEMLL